MSTLSLRNRPAPSLAEQARRLESFEIALRDQRIKDLEREIEQQRSRLLTLEKDLEISRALDQVSREELAESVDHTYALEHKLSELQRECQKLKEEKAWLTDEQKLSLERGAESLKREKALREKVIQLQRECQQLKDTRDEYEAAGNQLAHDKEKLQAEIERLAIQDNANARVLAKTQQQLKDALAEVKRLKALDPERLSKQVKRLKKEKAEALAGAKEMRTRNHQLAKRNQQLDAALDKAIADANAGMELKPVRVFEPGRVGRWELFTCEKNGWYQLLDAENEVSQTVRVEGDELVTPKIRPVPKAIAAEVLAFHQEHFGGAE